MDKDQILEEMINLIKHWSKNKTKLMDVLATLETAKAIVIIRSSLFNDEVFTQLLEEYYSIEFWQGCKKYCIDLQQKEAEKFYEATKR